MNAAPSQNRPKKRTAMNTILATLEYGFSKLLISNIGMGYTQCVRKPK